MRGGDGDRIIGGAQDDIAWASGRGEMYLGNLGHGGRSADVPRGVLGQGRPAELPGGRMNRTSGNKDGGAGKFYAPACPGYRGRFGGGKHPPPTVSPMRHDGPLVYTEQKVSCHHTEFQGSGTEEVVVSRGVIEGEHGEGF